MTKEGERLLHLQENAVAVITSGDGGGSAGPIGDDNSSTGPEVQSPFEMPDENLDSEEAREFGEYLCQRTAKDWAEAQKKDETANLVMEYIKTGTSGTDVSDDEMPGSVEASEEKRLITQG